TPRETELFSANSPSGTPRTRGSGTETRQCRLDQLRAAEAGVLLERAADGGVGLCGRVAECDERADGFVGGAALGPRAGGRERDVVEAALQLEHDPLRLLGADARDLAQR